MPNFDCNFQSELEPLAGTALFGSLRRCQGEKFIVVLREKGKSELAFSVESFRQSYICVYGCPMSVVPGFNTRRSAPVFGGCISNELMIPSPRRREKK